MGKLPKEIVLRDWDQFARFATQLEAGPPHKLRYLYRGQANSQWDLTPSLIRLAKKSGLLAIPQEILNLEAAALIHFQRQAHLHLSGYDISTVHRQDFCFWWILMQHYGVPTRILDWTRSPFVALYFAIEQQEENDGAIWAFHVGSVWKGLKEKYPEYKALPEHEMDQPKFFSETVESLLMLSANKQTDRMVAQQTSLTISPYILGDHGEIIKETLSENDYKGDVLVKLVVPKNLKAEFMRNLMPMNINAQSLFPGIDGLGRSAAELIKIGCLYAPTDNGKQSEDSGQGNNVIPLQE